MLHGKGCYLENAKNLHFKYSSTIDHVLKRNLRSEYLSKTQVILTPKVVIRPKIIFKKRLL